MEIKIKMFNEGLITENKLLGSFQGWKAYAKWANSYKLREDFQNEIDKILF